MSTYRVWHTDVHRAINISGIPRVFPEGSLEAISEAGNKITVRSSSDGVNVLYQLHFSRYARKDGTTFTTQASALAYLNSEFDLTFDTITTQADRTVRLGQSLVAYRAVELGGIYVEPNEDSLSRYLGILLQSGNAGDEVLYRRDGEIENNSWLWTPDEAIYVTNAGVLTQNLPVPRARRIGWAVTATTINLDLHSFLELGSADW